MQKRDELVQSPPTQRDTRECADADRTERHDAGLLFIRRTQNDRRGYVADGQDEVFRLSVWAGLICPRNWLARSTGRDSTSGQMREISTDSELVMHSMMPQESGI